MCGQINRNIIKQLRIQSWISINCYIIHYPLVVALFYPLQTSFSFIYCINFTFGCLIHNRNFTFLSVILSAEKNDVDMLVFLVKTANINSNI